MERIRRAVSMLSLALIVTLAADAQTIDSRAAQIEAARDAKAKELKPEVPSKIEQWMNENLTRQTADKFFPSYHGFSPKLGGAATSQGFAFGPEYLNRNLLNGHATLLANYQLTTTLGTRGEATLAFPRLAHERVLVDFSARRHNYNRIYYFGPGPDSEETGRSNYRYEDMAFDARTQFHITRKLYVGPNLGGLLVNVGPGIKEGVISAERQYSPPGIDHQTDFFRTGIYAAYDWRDVPEAARAGGIYGIDYNHYNDIDLNRYNFHLIKARAEQYVPFFNKRRVLALRAETILTWAGAGEAVPFYMQPVLGGADDLRGYRAYRFSGDNSLLMNAEYRWEIFSGLDGAIFADAGKVFYDKADLDFTDLESDVGFGLRFNIRNQPFLRIDVGFSHEGFRAWLSFGDVFTKKPMGRSSPEHVF